MNKAKKAKKTPVMKWHEMKQSTTAAELKAAYAVIGNFQKEMETPQNFGPMTLPVAAWLQGNYGSPELKAAARWARRLDKVSPEPWAKDALLRLAAHTRCDLQKASVLFVRGIFLGFTIKEANKKEKKTGKKYTEKFWQEELPQTCSDIGVRFRVLPLIFKVDNITLEVTANGSHSETVAA